MSDLLRTFIAASVLRVSELFHFKGEKGDIGMPGLQGERGPEVCDIFQ